MTSRTTTTATTNGWLASSRLNSQASLRLFCFPYAGGGTAIYRSWAASLPAEVEVCAVQLPGRGTRLREPLATSLLPLVRQAAREMLPLFDRPFAFFGHSMGAITSFEMARHLRDEYDLHASQLFVSGRSEPRLQSTSRPIHLLPEAEFIEELRRLNGTPREALENEELMQLMLPVLRADFSVCETYSYTHGAALDCPITAFGGMQDPDIGRERLEGWGAHTGGSFVLRMLPGDHFFIHTAQHMLLASLGRELQQLSAKVERGEASPSSSRAVAGAAAAATPRLQASPAL